MLEPEKLIFRHDRKYQNAKDCVGDFDPVDESVIIAAPAWVQEGLNRLSKKLKDAALVNRGNSEKLSNPLTLRELSAIARCEIRNVTGIINFQLYQNIDEETVIAIRDLVRHLVIVGKGEYQQYGGYPKTEAVTDLPAPHPIYICDLAGLQFQNETNTGRFVLIGDDLVKGDLDDLIYERTVGEKKPSKEEARKDPDRYLNCQFLGNEYLFDKKAFHAFVEQDFILGAITLNKLATKNKDLIDYKFLKYGTGFFASKLTGPAKEELNLNLALGIEKGIKSLLSLPKEVRQQIKRIEMPHFVTQNPDLLNALIRIQNICDKNNLEYSYKNEDALKPTSHYVIATTNCADTHAPTGNEMSYQSVDAAIALNVHGYLNKFNAALNKAMQMIFIELPKRLPFEACANQDTVGDKQIQLEQKRQRIRQTIDAIQKRPFNYVQFINEHKTALISMVFLTSNMTFYFGLSLMLIGTLTTLSFAGTLGFQLIRDKIANRALKDSLDNEIIKIEPTLDNTYTKFFQYDANNVNDAYYLEKGKNAQRSWPGYAKCPWTLPGSNNNSLVQVSRKMVELTRQVNSELTCEDEKKKTKKSL